MLDIETLGVRPHSIVVVIGAIKFERDIKIYPIEKYEKFYIRINSDSCRNVGMIKEENTINWWYTQDSKVRYEALENPDRVDIKKALEEFTKWFGKSTYIWGNGDDFDCSILGEAYKRCNMEIPWKFYNTRDVRTLYDITGVTKYDIPIDNMHNALYDCYRQIIGLKLSFKRLETPILH